MKLAGVDGHATLEAVFCKGDIVKKVQVQGARINAEQVQFAGFAGGLHEAFEIWVWRGWEVSGGGGGRGCRSGSLGRVCL